MLDYSPCRGPLAAARKQILAGMTSDSRTKQPPPGGGPLTVTTKIFNRFRWKSRLPVAGPAQGEICPHPAWRTPTQNANAALPRGMAALGLPL
jgi:hypothetical protein